MVKYKRYFPTGIPVMDENLAGREKEKDLVKQLLKNGQSVILYGPRRIGKTSIALTVLNELKTEGYFTGHADIFECATLQVLSQRITETTLNNKKLSKIISSLKENLSEAFKNLQIKQTINDFEWMLKFTEKNKNEHELFSTVLDFPDKFAKKHKAHMIMFIDEIGDIDKFDSGNLIKLMRSKFQLHNNVTYLFAGSQQSVIENIFVDKTGPFYRFGQLMPIDTIQKDAFKEYLILKFNEVKVNFTHKALDYLLDITDGHPYYTQLLCRELYFYAMSHNTVINNETVEFTLQEAIFAEDIYFSKIWEEIAANSAQINILHNIIENKNSLYNNNSEKKLNVSRTLNQLQNKGLIRKEAKGRFKFVDPLFAEYVKRKFL